MFLFNGMLIPENHEKPTLSNTNEEPGATTSDEKPGITAVSLKTCPDQNVFAGNSGYPFPR